MMVETHMLKPYRKRVEGTYELMVQMMLIAEKEGASLKELRKDAFDFTHKLTHYPTQWQIDTTRSSVLNFRGYEADTLLSEVTGMPRLKYDRTRPFTKEVPYQNYMVPKDSVSIPDFYIVKKGYDNVMALMELNKIDFEVLEKDTILTAETYSIAEYKTKTQAYEGHYLHYDTKVARTRYCAILFVSKNLKILPLQKTGMRS